MEHIEDLFYDAYQYFNFRLFSESLPPCFITIREAPKSMGYFSPERFSNGINERHEIALNSRYFNSRPLEETLSTLVHEMCHLWQAVYGKPGRGAYHNREWAEKMESIGLLPTATGIIDDRSRKTGDHVTHAIDPNGIFRKTCDEYLIGKKIVQWYDVFSEKCISITRLNYDEKYRNNLQNTGNSIEAITEIIKPIINKQTRVRYSCECEEKNHVWGKPGLNIKCMTCDKMFLADIT